MKFISMVTAVLITCSSYGQGHVEYRDFKFCQNGAEISFEEVTELTKEYGVAKADFRQGRRDFAASESASRATRRNLTNGGLAFSGGYGALMGLAFWLFEDDAVMSTVYIASASASAWGAYYFQRLLATKKKFKERANEKFKTTAKKLNEAIVSSGNTE
jgi:hypothetical protein